MKETVGIFDYDLKEEPKDSQTPFPPQIFLCLKRWGKTTQDGAPIFSSSLMTDQEIDFYVQKLKEDLEAVATAAKSALKKAKQNIKKSTAQHRKQ